MPLSTKDQPLIQKPFRCSQDLVMQINRTKGALMLKTGKRISDNEFILHLIRSGLDLVGRDLDLNQTEGPATVLEN